MSLFNISSNNGQNDNDNNNKDDNKNENQKSVSNLDNALKILNDDDDINGNSSINNEKKTLSEELGIVIPSDVDFNSDNNSIGIDEDFISIDEELEDLNKIKLVGDNNGTNDRNDIVGNSDSSLNGSKNENLDNSYSLERLSKKERKKIEKQRKKEEKNKEKEKKKSESKKGINLYAALTEKITGMGYSYNMLSLLKTVLFFGFIIFFFAYLHKLKLIYIISLILSLLLLIPFSIYFQYKYLYEQKRFNQLKTYLKFMRLNFKQYQKIIIALKETRENFSEDEEIYNFITKAINEIENGNDFRSALDIIEIPFKNSYITKLHAYMILAETEGGKSAFDALDTIDFETWESDTYIFQTQKFKFQGQNSIYTLLGLAISLSIVFIFSNMMKDPSTRDVFGLIFEELTFQLVTFFYILIDLVSFIMIKTMITSKWVREDE